MVSLLGSPVYRMSFSDTTDERLEKKELEEDGWVLTNNISLSFKQVEELLKFLVSEEHALILTAADDDKDVREACAMVVELIVERRRKKTKGYE